MQSTLGASRLTVQARVKARAAALRQPGRRSLTVLAIAAPVQDDASIAQQQKQQSGDSLTSAAVAAAAR